MGLFGKKKPQLTKEEKRIQGDYNMGIGYSSGIFPLKKNEAEAMVNMQRAADAGYPKALYMMGEWYRDGLNVERNSAKAMEYFQLAYDCEDQDPKTAGLAAMGMGLIYHEGNGIEKDWEAAAMWYQRSLALGNQLAEAGLRLLKKEENEG